MSNELVVVERVKSFLKWNPDKFEVLDSKTTIANMLAPTWGWRKGDEFWIRPSAWQEHLCAGEFDPQDVARTLKALDLLRVQDDRTFQCCVKARGKTERAYVVSQAILEWKPPVTYARHNGHTGADTLKLDGASRVNSTSENTCSPTLIPTTQDDAAGLLHQGVVKGLRMAIDTLDTELDPSDRNYGALLRAKTALANTLITTQCRIDESRLRAKQADELLPALLESLKVEQAKLAKVDFRRTWDDGSRVGSGVETPPENEPSA